MIEFVCLSLRLSRSFQPLAGTRVVCFDRPAGRQKHVSKDQRENATPSPPTTSETRKKKRFYTMNYEMVYLITSSVSG